jgi:hypothetical protein
MCKNQLTSPVRVCLCVVAQGASNNFSFIGVPLFTGEVAGPLQRLERVGRAMAWVRHSVVVPIALHVPEIIQVCCARMNMTLCKPSTIQGVSLCVLPDRVSQMGCPKGSGVYAGVCVSLYRHACRQAAIAHTDAPALTPALLLLLACLLPQTIFRHPVASSKAILRALPLKTTIGFSNMKGPAGSWSLSGYKVRGGQQWKQQLMPAAAALSALG